MMIKIRTQKYRKGFGILEVLISSVIIVIILGALVQVGNLALRTNMKARNRSEATFLAQEGLEIVRQIRDTNWIDSDSATKWDSFYEGTPTAGTGKLSYIASKDRYLLQMDGSAENISLGDDLFGRYITLTNLDGTALLPDDQNYLLNINLYAVKVNVVVYWNYNTERVEASEILTNWRPNF